MVSVSPVKLPFSVNIHEQTVDSLSILIEGEKKCVVTFYVCVNITELQKVVEQKRFTNERTLVDVLNLLSVWISEPEYVSISEGAFAHKFSYTALPLDVRERLEQVLYDVDSQEACVPLVMQIQLVEEECETLVAENDVLSILNVITTSSRGSTSSFTSPQSSPVIPSAPPMDSISSCGSSSSSTSCGGLSGMLKYKINDQYIETVDRRVFILKKLFKSGVDHIDEEPTSAEEQPNSSSEQQAVESGEFCLICQEHPVSRALLPCRHLCSCKICFSKLTLCPICRQDITSFFVVRNEESLPDVEPVVEERDDISSLIQNEGIWSFIKSIWNAS